jgi:hypothetical protein
MRTILQLSAFVSFVVAQFTAAHAHAATAVAAAPGKASVVPIPGNQNTYSLKAHSNRTNNPVTGPNTTVINSTGVAHAFNDVIVIKRLFWWDTTYKPAVAVIDQPKKNDAVSITSMSTNTVQGMAVVDPVNARLEAFGRVGEGAKGSAAGEAIDPYYVAPGTYSDYSFVIDQIELGTADVGDFAGVNFFATDSRFSDPLWFLSVVVSGPLSSKSDLVIGFASNPILALNDSNIVNNVRAAFNMQGQTATLNSFELFKTTYVVDQQITYSEGLKAGVEAVPEPGTLMLFGMGVIALVGYARPRGKELP